MADLPSVRVQDQRPDTPTLEKGFLDRSLSRSRLILAPKLEVPNQQQQDEAGPSTPREHTQVGHRRKYYVHYELPTSDRQSDRDQAQLSEVRKPPNRISPISTKINQRRAPISGFFLVPDKILKKIQSFVYPTPYVG